ncbi:hypothetical protein Rs2_47869 [Raphanus sativus]|nr:hypothetical protein Rs2_47869 [Raphanus sativus]
MFENRYPFRGSSSAGKYSSPPPPQTVNESQIATATQVHLNRHGINTTPFLCYFISLFFYRCSVGLLLFSERKVSFLLDAEDTIAEYENNAKAKRTEKLEKQEG